MLFNWWRQRLIKKQRVNKTKQKETKRKELLLICLLLLLFIGTSNKNGLFEIVHSLFIIVKNWLICYV